MFDIYANVSNGCSRIAGLKEKCTLHFGTYVILPCKTVADVQHYPEYMKRPNEERRSTTDAPTPHPLKLKQYTSKDLR